MYSYIITDEDRIHSRIDYRNDTERTILHPDYSLLSSAYLAIIAQQQQTDERGTLERLGVILDEEAEQWLSVS